MVEKAKATELSFTRRYMFAMNCSLEGPKIQLDLVHRLCSPSCSRTRTR